jgi:hypothetical protein
VEAVPSFTETGRQFELGGLAALGLRIRVQWSKDRLTRELAAGAPSTASRELALRAGQLTAKSTRELVASSIEQLLEDAYRPAPVLSARVPIDRRKLRAGREQLVALVDRLRSERPIQPCGMALALLLLTDPEKPLLGVASANQVAAAIIEATERLESAS